jgi:hypothetical protein
LLGLGFGSISIKLFFVSLLHSIMMEGIGRVFKIPDIRAFNLFGGWFWF